jgi:hypothetical protein
MCQELRSLFFNETGFAATLEWKLPALAGIKKPFSLAAAGHKRFHAPQAIRGIRKGDFSGAL